jgi:hypothetical protein
VAPTFQPTLPKGSELQSAAFAPDDKTCYIHVRLPTIDAWSTIVHYWREEAPALLTLIFIACAALAVHPFRRRQRRHTPYCRRCNYDLSTIAAPHRDEPRRFSTAPGAPCPECGADLERARPRAGRPAIIRIAPQLVAFTLPVAAYAAALIAGAPRDGWLSERFDWSSSRLADFATAHSVSWLTPRIRKSDQVLAFDLEKGSFRGVLSTRRSSSYGNIQVSRDGSLLFLGGSNGEGSLVTAISTSSGREVHALPARGRTPTFHRMDSILGTAPDGRIVYVAWVEMNGEACGVLAWNIDTGSETELVRTSAGRLSAGFALLGTDGRHFVSVPSFTEVNATKSYKIHMYEEGRGPAEFHQLDLGGEISPDARPAFASDGSVMFVPSKRQALLAVPLPSGSPLALIPAPGETWHDLTISADSSVLLVPFMGATPPYRILDQSVLAWDTKLQRWIAEFLAPNGLIAPRAVISPSKRWVAAVYLTHPASLAGGHQMAIWDAGKILPAPVSSAAPPPPPKS